MTGIPRYFCKSCLKVCREEADLIGDGREFQRRVLVKSGEIVPGRRAALGMQSERVNWERVVLCVLFEGDLSLYCWQSKELVSACVHQQVCMRSLSLKRTSMEQSFISLRRGSVWVMGARRKWHAPLLAESGEVFFCWLWQWRIERVWSIRQVRLYHRKVVLSFCIRAEFLAGSVKDSYLRGHLSNQVFHMRRPG